MGDLLAWLMFETDPSKQQRYDRPGRGERVMASIEPDDVAENEAVVSAPVVQSGLQRRNNGSPSQHYAQPMVSSVSRDRYHTPSPERGSPGRDRSPGRGRPLSNAPPPLLMAPPTTWTGDVRQRVQLGWYQIGQLIEFNGVSISLPFLVRLGIFLGKVVSLTRPCWPYMVDPWLGSVLLLLGGLDLGSTVTPPPSNSSLYLIPRRATWDDAGQNGPGFGLRDVRLSVLLVILHFVILWVANRSGPLCALYTPNGTAPVL